MNTNKPVTPQAIQSLWEKHSFRDHLNCTDVMDEENFTAAMLEFAEACPPAPNETNRWGSTEAFSAACKAATEVLKYSPDGLWSIAHINTFQDQLLLQGYTVARVATTPAGYEWKTLKQDRDNWVDMCKAAWKSCANWINRYDTTTGFFYDRQTELEASLTAERERADKLSAELEQIKQRTVSNDSPTPNP